MRFAAIVVAAGRAADAARILACADALQGELELTLESWAAEEREATLATIRSVLDAAAFAEACEQGRALTVDEAAALALESLA